MLMNTCMTTCMDLIITMIMITMTTTTMIILIMTTTMEISIGIIMIKMVMRSGIIMSMAKKHIFMHLSLIPIPTRIPIQVTLLIHLVLKMTPSHLLHLMKNLTAILMITLGIIMVIMATPTPMITPTIITGMVDILTIILIIPTLMIILMKTQDILTTIPTLMIIPMIIQNLLNPTLMMETPWMGSSWKLLYNKKLLLLRIATNFHHLSIYIKKLRVSP